MHPLVHAAAASAPCRSIAVATAGGRNDSGDGLTAAVSGGQTTAAVTGEIVDSVRSLSDSAICAIDIDDHTAAHMYFLEAYTLFGKDHKLDPADRDVLGCQLYKRYSHERGKTKHESQKGHR
jgi:hypothetical protein